MSEILTILAIGGVLLGIAVAAYVTTAPILTEIVHKRKLQRLAANQRRLSADLDAMRRAAK